MAISVKSKDVSQLVESEALNLVHGVVDVPLSIVEVELVGVLDISSAVIVRLDSVEVSKRGYSDTNEGVNSVP